MFDDVIVMLVGVLVIMLVNDILSGNVGLLYLLVFVLKFCSFILVLFWMIMLFSEILWKFGYSGLFDGMVFVL